MRHSTDSAGNDARPTGDVFPLPTRSVGYQAAVSITRPANTTAYTAGDVIGVDGGTAQVETATAAGTITGSGDAAVIVTGALIAGSPLTVPVAVLEDDTAAEWAAKVRTALGDVAAITDAYTVGGSTTAISLTAKTPAANDTTLNISLDNDTCTGITTAATSANTTAGSLSSTNAGSAILEFENIGPEGGMVRIVGASLRVDVDAVPTGMTTMRLALYDAAPAAILDNAAFDLAAADRAKFLGFVDLGTVVDEGSTLFVQTDSLSKQVKLADGSTSLFGVLTTVGGYTPASATVHDCNGPQ
jgi:hypothetical protein